MKSLKLHRLSITLAITALVLFAIPYLIIPIIGGFIDFERLISDELGSILFIIELAVWILNIIPILVSYVLFTWAVYENVKQSRKITKILILNLITTILLIYPLYFSILISTLILPGLFLK